VVNGSSIVIFAVKVALVHHQEQVLSAVVVSATPLQGQGDEGEDFRYDVL